MLRKFFYRHSLLNVDTVNRRIIQLALTCRNSLTTCVKRDVRAAHSHDGSRNVDCGISRADNRNVIAQFVSFRISQIIYRVMNISQRLSFATGTARSPNAGADKYGVVTVFKKIVQMNRTAYRRVRAKMYSHFAKFGLVTVDNFSRQTESRNTVAHHSAYFVHTFKNCNSVTAGGKFHGDCNSRRTGTDYRNFFSGVRFPFDNRSVEVRI